MISLNTLHNILHQKLPLTSSLTPLNKMANRAKNRQNLSVTSPPEQLAHIKNYLQRFLILPCTKVAQRIALFLMKLPLELKSVLIEIQGFQSALVYLGLPVAIHIRIRCSDMSHLIWVWAVCQNRMQFPGIFLGHEYRQNEQKLPEMVYIIPNFFISTFW